MKLYIIYSVADLDAFQRMLIMDRTRLVANGGDKEAISELTFKIDKIEQEKRRRLNNLEFVAGDDPSEKVEYEPTKANR